MDKILARKAIISLTLAVIATAFLIQKITTAERWQWIFMATVVTYITARTIEKSRHPETRQTTLTERIKALGSREFILAYTSLILASLLCQLHLIADAQWFPVVTTIAGAYNIGTALSKP